MEQKELLHRELPVVRAVLVEEAQEPQQAAQAIRHLHRPRRDQMEAVLVIPLPVMVLAAAAAHRLLVQMGLQL